jgi:hydroxymethylglutaryl-CoA lyase
VKAAYDAGCRRFDSTLGGVGSAPAALIGMQPDALIENLPTELVIDTLKELGATVPDLEALDRLIVTSRELERKFGVVVQ